jgi:hypothetical protein
MFNSQNNRTTSAPPSRMSNQNQNQYAQQPAKEGIAGISKLTIAQAITLITLRLGKLETHLHNVNNGMAAMSGEGSENLALIDKSVIDSIMLRLESLEKRSSASGSNAEMLLLKQQVETLKPTIVQSKTALTASVKEQKDLKQQIQLLRNELNESKDLLAALQALTMDNSQKILAMGEFEVIEGEEGEELEALETIGDVDETEQAEELGTNLKELIEQELNGN